MAATLELFDGSTTLDLNGSVYIVDFDRLGFASASPRPLLAGTVLRNVRYEPRVISMTLQIRGTSALDLETQIRALNEMLSLAERRQIIDDGTTKIVLKYQTGTTNSRDVETRVLSGIWQPDGAVLSKLTVDDHFLARGTLSLTCEPFGRLAKVTFLGRDVNPEQDGDSVNYLDISGRFNSYLQFPNASDDIVVIDDATMQDLPTGGGVTIEAWIRTASGTAAQNGRILDKGVVDSGGYAFFVQTANELVFEADFDSTNGKWSSTATVLTDGTWHHVAVTYDGSSVANDPIMYVDGVSVSVTEDTTPVGSYVSDVGNSLLIGNSSPGSAHFVGDIDEVRLWSDIRTVSEIADNKDSELAAQTSSGGAAIDAGLVSVWTFDENVGATVYDRQQVNGNDGTITGADWAIDSSIIGDASAPLRVIVPEIPGTAYQSIGKMWLATRSGERRTDQLMFHVPDSVVEGTDPGTSDASAFTSGTTGGLTAFASGGTSAFIRFTQNGGSLENESISVGYFQFDIAGASLPRGLFRVMARVSAEYAVAALGVDDVSNFGFTFGHLFGTLTAPSADPIAAKDRVMFVAADVEDEWHWLDLGELSIPPIALSEDDITPPDLNLRIHAIWSSASGETWAGAEYVEWACNQVFLLPIDESVVVVDAVPVSGTNVVHANAIADTPGIWMTTTSDVIGSIPDFNGGPLQIGPETTRLYYLKDDTGNPSAVGSALIVQYEPQIRTL